MLVDSLRASNKTHSQHSFYRSVGEQTLLIQHHVTGPMACSTHVLTKARSAQSSSHNVPTTAMPAMLLGLFLCTQHPFTQPLGHPSTDPQAQRSHYMVATDSQPHTTWLWSPLFYSRHLLYWKCMWKAVLGKLESTCLYSMLVKRPYHIHCLLPGECAP